MILLGALLDPGEQVMILLDQRIEQRPVIRRQHPDECVERGVLRKRIMAGERAASLGARVPGHLNGLGLGVDGGDDFVDQGRLAADHRVLLLIQQRQHFAILGQFFAQVVDETIEFVHE